MEGIVVVAPCFWRRMHPCLCMCRACTRDTLAQPKLRSVTSSTLQLTFPLSLRTS
jgi:hypothetical protein